MSRTVEVSAANATLFHVAAAQMGDAFGAIRIAQASGLSDPWLTGLAVLTVPGLGPDTGGLPAPGTTP